MKKLVLSLALLGLAAPAAFAQSPTNFADVDTDGNGELSFAELQVVWPDLSEEEFNSADADASTGISIAELNSLQPAAVPAAPADAPAAPAESLTESGSSTD